MSVLFCSHKPFSYVPSFHIYKKDENSCLILDFIKRCHIYKKDNIGCFMLAFFGSDLPKMDQT